MTTATVNTTEKSVTKKATKKAQPMTEAQKIERKEKYLQSDYYNKVNKVNAQAKQYTRTFSGARALLLKAMDEGKEIEGFSFEMTQNFAKILRGSKKVKAVYRHAMDNVRTYKSKAGESYGTHSILQWMYKNETELLEMVSSKGLTAVTSK